MLNLQPLILLIKESAKRNIIDLGFSAALLCNYFMNMWSGSAGDPVSLLLSGERASRVSLFFQSGSSRMERLPRLIKSCLRGGGEVRPWERGGLNLLGFPGGHRQQFLQPDQESKPQGRETRRNDKGGTKLAWIQTIPWLELYLFLCGSLLHPCFTSWR